MRITVKFHGLLGKLCPGEHTVEANNAYEALRIVCKNNEKKLTRKNGHRFNCFCKQVKTKDDLYKRGGSTQLDVIPSFAPSGGGTVKQAWITTAIVLAVYVIIVAVAFIFTGPAGAAATAKVLLPYAISMTAAAWIGALAQHLQKDKKPDQNETQQNYAFGMNGNTTKVGTAIPVGYGRYRVYGHLLSWGTSTSEPIWTTTGKKVHWFGRDILLNAKKVISGMSGPQIKDGTVNQW